jgi:hypothetical protein
MRLDSGLDKTQSVSRPGHSPWGVAYETRTAAGAAALLEYSLRNPKAFTRAAKQAAFDMLCELLEHCNDAMFHDEPEREEP